MENKIKIMSRIFLLDIISKYIYFNKTDEFLL